MLDIVLTLRAFYDTKMSTQALPVMYHHYSSRSEAACRDST